ncbi:MAG: PP2C family protein-serine/threonine phosphatase [Candidatus Xenobia bacterium]
MRDRNFRVLPVTPVIFILTGLLALLRFRLPVHREIVIPVAAAFSIVAALVSRLRRGSIPYLLLELTACTVIVAASGGSRSPFLLIYLVPILEASLGLGNPWGFVFSLVTLLLLTLTERFVMSDRSVFDLDRITATWPFFMIVGVLTATLADNMAREVAERAVIDAEARLRSRELAISREIQQALLPQQEPELPGWDIAWRLLPQQAVAGDLVFFQGEGDTLRAGVADVMGKGVSAAMLVGTVHQLMLRYAREAPVRATHKINLALCDSTPATISVSTIVMDVSAGSGRIELCNAGHPYPVLWHSGASAEIPGSNLIAGWFADTSFTPQAIRMEPGDILLLYTDGLTDVQLGADRRLDLEGVCHVLAANAQRTSSEIADALLQAVGQGAQVDDVSLIVLRRLA